LKILRNLLFGMVFSGTVAAAVNSIDLPDMGDSTGTILSPEFERRLGQAFLGQIRKEANIISDPEIETYIQSIGYRLVSQSDNNTQPFTFFIINDSLINAFAAPGGIVGINSGVILSSDTESELAGVMAHEITHVTQKHMARSYEMQQKMSIPMMAAMLGAVLLMTQNPEAGQAALIAIQGGAAQAQINFTRGNEEEADRIGMQLLSRAEYDPRGMSRFFEKLQKNSRYYGQAPEFLRTHPITTNRIAEARARSQSIPVDVKYEESKRFPFIQAKLAVYSYRKPRDAVQSFRERLNNERYGNMYLPLRYGYALALMGAGEYDLAAEHLLEMLAEDPENSTYLLAVAELEFRRRNLEEAFRIYQEALEIYPDYRPVILKYAHSLLEARRPEDARDVLKDYGKFNEPDLTYYQYLTQAEAEAGNPIESGLASAEYHYLSGETVMAVRQLQLLLRQNNPSPDYYQAERLQDRLVFMEQELKIERDMKLIR